MATMKEWAAYFSGNYQGRARLSNSADWEDLIGTVELKCAARKDGGLSVTITTIEFGKWTGSLRLHEAVVEGTTGQKNAYFKCAFQERRAAAGIQICFQGGVYRPPAKPLLELSFTSDWRKRRPEPPPRRAPG